MIANPLSARSGGSGAAVSSPVDVGPITGSVAIDRALGDYFYGHMTGDTDIQAPTNGSRGQFCRIGIRWTTAAHELTFTGIQMSTEAAALLPITLTMGMGYLITLFWEGGGWVLQSIDEFPQTEAP